jgi:hypothetical protein
MVISRSQAVSQGGTNRTGPSHRFVYLSTLSEEPCYC